MSQFALPWVSVQEELLDHLPILFLSHVFMLPQFDSVTDFHGREFSVSQHSGFQVIWSNNSLWTFLQNRVPKVPPKEFVWLAGGFCVCNLSVMSV